MPSTNPITVVTSSRIRPDEFQRLRSLAESRDSTVSRLSARFLREGLSRHGV
jgi:hypothetical protein